MLIDIHITTCHRSNVTCRPRPQPSTAIRWNVKEWTREERLEISKVSVDSIKRFVDQMRIYNDVNLTLIDDGSDYGPALDWLNSLQDISIKHYHARGSSAGINDHIDTLERIPDYIMHIEDDHVLFNPENINFIDAAIEAGNNVTTLRSGLPFSQEDRGYLGAWGPTGFVKGEHCNFVRYNKMGNAHHIIPFSLYKHFLPLEGNTGGCEAFMNNILTKNGVRNFEPQIHVHAFHSHRWQYPIDTISLDQWHKTGEGWEYGIKDMHEYLLTKHKVNSTLRGNEGEIVYSTFENYAY